MPESVGVYLDEDVIDELDEIKRERDRLGREHASRSAVAADAIQLGLVALEFFEERDPRMPPASKRTALYQALEDLYAEGDE